MLNFKKTKPMYEKQIKEWLINNQSRVYSIIVDQYPKEIKDFKPTLFRLWLSEKIDIPKEKINLSSLNSAIGRFKKNQEKSQRGEKTTTQIPETKIQEKKDDYKFAKSEEISKPSGTIEM